MKLDEAILSLYDIIAVDKKLRNELLRDIVIDDEVCMLLSIQGNFTYNNAKVTRGNSSSTLDIVLLDVLTSPKSNWERLSIQQQVVLKELLNPKSTVFSMTIFYTYGKKVFTREEILNILKNNLPKNQKIPYILLDPPRNNKLPFYYKTIYNNKTLYNNIPYTLGHVECSNNETIVLDYAGNTVASGDVLLGRYLRGVSGSYGSSIRGFIYGKDIHSIQHTVNGRATPKIAVVLYDNGIKILHKEKIKVTCDIIDLAIDDDYNITGVWVAYAGNSYLINISIPNKIIDVGIHMYQVKVLAHEQLNGKLKQIKFLSFIERGEV